VARVVTVSPFRSYKGSERAQAAQEMIDRRTSELAALKALARHESNPAKQRRLATAILATANNLKSWQTYLENGAEHEKRATVIPGRKKTNG
jgi:hypothetical protein